MAVAAQTAVTALGMSWWETSYTDATRSDAVAEILRQGNFLANAWSAQEQTLLVGIGDAFNESADPPSLLTYSDFGIAPNALMIGQPPADDPFGQNTTVRPRFWCFVHFARSA